MITPWRVSLGMSFVHSDCGFPLVEQVYIGLPISYRVIHNCSKDSKAAMCVVRRSNTVLVTGVLRLHGPRLWNRLSIRLRECDSLELFKRLLKTHLFGAWDRGALWGFRYLLTWYPNVLDMGSLAKQIPFSFYVLYTLQVAFKFTEL